MKSLIILFAGNSRDYQFDKVFNGKSAFARTLDWADTITEDKNIAVLCTDDNISLVQEEINACGIKAECVNRKNYSQEDLFAVLAELSSKDDYSMVLYSYACLPFINTGLCRELIDTHTKYLAEYSFADGYAKGCACEILDKGLCQILLNLVKTKDDVFKSAAVNDESIFNLIKTDINSFEIETVISNIDWRLYRFNFSCNSLENFTACKNLYEKAGECSDVQELTKIASKEVSVLKTVSAFFNIQLEKKSGDNNPYSPYTKLECSSPESMSLEKFKVLVKKIAAFNKDAVIGLSLWGEPLLHPDFIDAALEVLKNPGLSLLIETNGVQLSSDAESRLSELASYCGEKTCNGYEKLMWIVSVDAMTEETYQKIHPGKKLSDALNFIAMLKKYFSSGVYPQFVRMNVNEDELESFYRTYKDSSLCNGNFVIQKYDSFCKKMSDEKPADLSPLERLPCWHIRREMNILADGNVVRCKDSLFENVTGNVFESSLEDIWACNDSIVKEHIDCNYCQQCRDCDEYYTYNF